MGIFFFFKQKTAYEMRISDRSSDVCSSDLYCHCQRQGTCNQTIYRPAEVIPGQWNICSDCVATLMMSVTLEIKESHPMRVAILDEIGRASCRERVCQYV